MRLKSTKLTGYTDTDSRRDSQKVWIHVDLKGETVLENLQRRRARPTALYEALVVAHLARLGVWPKELTWKQTLACKCGCSPGFLAIVEDHAQRAMLVTAVKGTNPKREAFLSGPLTLHLTIDIS